MIPSEFKAEQSSLYIYFVPTYNSLYPIHEAK